MDSDRYVICLFRRKEEGEVEESSSMFVNQFEQIVRDCGGIIQLRSDRPQDWDIYEGHDHLVEKDHLNPAIFDFNSIIIAAFDNSEEVHKWWDDDNIFKLLKTRTSIEKIGVYAIEGLQKAFDITDHNQMYYGEKFILFEFMKMLSFKPTQQYVEEYKRLASMARQQIGIDCNLLLAEAVSNVFIDEFSLEAACASSWRAKSDAMTWCDSEIYQQRLLPLRKSDSLCLTMLVPIFEHKPPQQQGKKQRTDLNTLLTATR